MLVIISGLRPEGIRARCYTRLNSEETWFEGGRFVL
ncbi:hypothetical protein F383_39449 [Gossypium arboreum]|uniref:Uncharacterized protein n=1 Tax=Gossypium arboreum TaxID=29729 RepID=A0A0B0MV14_GOSAR|nr:hypothetical protein F383_39449 [Gossypium arboreum]